MSNPIKLSNSTQVLQKFKNAYIQFIDMLIEQFPQETDLVILRVFLDNQIPVTDMADIFTKYVLPYKDIIEKRDESYFLDKDDIFGSLSSSHVFQFKKLWTSENLDSEDRVAIWEWFSLFCNLMEAYNKVK